MEYTCKSGINCLWIYLAVYRKWIFMGIRVGKIHFAKALCRQFIPHASPNP